MGRKKIQSECKENEDNPLELLPERGSKVSLKSNINDSSSSSGNDQPLFKAINHLLTDVFYRQRESASIEEMKGDSILAQSLNYLFIESEENKC